MGRKKSSVPNRQYTLELKIEAVRLSESVGASEAARRLDIPESSIWNWIRLKRVGKLEGSATATGPVRRPISEVEAELSRLRRENASLKEENDLLKKAAAYFAKQSK
jgi:transposase